MTTRDPQSLSDDFYQRMEAYLKSLDQENTSTDPNTAKGRLSLKEKEVATRLFSELRETRLRKLLLLAQNHETIDNSYLTAEEGKFVKDVETSLQTLDQTKEEFKSSASEEKVELSVVRFLQDIPEIVGTDLKIYGPYKKEDVGSLPYENADALVRQGAAKQVEVGGIFASQKN